MIGWRRALFDDWPKWILPVAFVAMVMIALALSLTLAPVP